MAERAKAGQGRTKPSGAVEATPGARKEGAGRRPATGGQRGRLAPPFRRPAQPARRSRQRPGRYTPPTPRELRRSPSWYPWLLLGLAVAGVGVIIANYASALPGSPTNWYTLGSLIALLSAALLATRYH